MNQGRWVEEIRVPRSKAIEAWRVWRVSSGNWSLAKGTITSLYSTSKWTKFRIKEAHCSGCRRNEGIPSKSHGFTDGMGCGIAGLKTRALAREIKLSHFRRIGKVLLWGLIQVHEDGYRAQYGKILRLTERPEPLKKKGKKR